MELQLDEWLPDPQIRTRHRRTAGVPREQLWHAAETVRVCEAPTSPPPDPDPDRVEESPAPHPEDSPAEPDDRSVDPDPVDSA